MSSFIYSKVNTMLMPDLLDSVLGLGLCLLTRSSEFIYMNKICRDILGFKNQSALEGKSYIDAPCPASENFEAFMATDQAALKCAYDLKFLSIQKFSAGWTMSLVEKKLIRNEHGEIVGICNVCRDVQEKSFSDSSLFLTLFDTASRDFKNKKSGHYYLNGEISDLKISQREKEVIFYLIRGKTAKEIALMLGLTYRTVERYMDALKIKFDCSSKSQLIEKARNQGYLNILPETLL